MFRFIAHPLSYVPSLHGRYPLHRYYGRSDFRRTVLSPRFEAEFRALPGRKFTAYLSFASNHSVSSHVMCAPERYPCHRRLSVPDTGQRPRGCSADFPQGSLGSGSRFRVSMARSPVTPHRIEFIGEGLTAPLRLRTGCSLPVALHGRLFAAAVSFRYRLDDFGLAGTHTLLRC